MLINKLNRKITDFRRKYLIFYISEKRRELKLKALEYKGGKCEICGYNKCPASLVFHHKDPSKKDFGISSNKKSYKSLEDIKTELDKCILLCSNCHNELHYKQWNEIRKIKQKEIISKTKTKVKENSKCDCCGYNIEYLISKKSNKNFCCLNCKRAYFFKKDWGDYKELRDQFISKSIANFSKLINKSISTLYKRKSEFIFLSDNEINTIKCFSRIIINNNIYGEKTIEYNSYLNNISIINNLIKLFLIKNVDNDNYQLTNMGYLYFMFLSYPS